MDFKGFQKFITDSERGTEKKCFLCQKKFGIATHEHQCKRCLRAVCSDCGDRKTQIFKQNMKKGKHRLCKVCKEESNSLVEYVENNRLVFGEMSDVSRKWMKKIVKRPDVRTMEDKKFKKFSKEYFNQMWDCYNYSLRELIGLLTYDKNQDDIYQIVFEVVKAVSSARPDQRIQSIALVAIFFLCFSNTDTAQIISLYLIDLRNTVEDQKGLVQTYLKALSLSENQIKKMNFYLNSANKKFYSCFSLNCLSIESSIYLVSRIIERKKIDELYIFLALSMEFNKESIIGSGQNVLTAELAVLRNSSIEVVTAKSRQIATVKSSPFMSEVNENVSTSMIESKTSKQLMEEQLNIEKTTRAFDDSEQGIRSVREIKKQNSFVVEEEKGLFSKKPRQREHKEKQDDNYTEDSFSIISMLNMGKEEKAMEEPSAGNILGFLMNPHDLSHSDKGEHYHEDNTNQRLELSLEEMPKQKIHKNISSVSYSPNQFSSQCSNCQQMHKQINSFTIHTQPLDPTQLIKLQKENKELKEMYKAKELEYDKILKRAQSSESEAQIKKLKDQVQMLTIEKETAEVLRVQNAEQRKTIKRYQLDVLALRQKLNESESTQKMLRNKFQNLSLMSSQNYSRGQDREEQIEKVNINLKSALMEKNQQLETLMKQNKILNYQMEQVSKVAMEEKSKSELEVSLSRWEKEKNELLGKMKQLSERLMEEEGERLILAEQNYNLVVLIKSKGLKWD